jgi:hypothetical protein
LRWRKNGSRIRRNKWRREAGIEGPLGVIVSIIGRIVTITVLAWYLFIGLWKICKILNYVIDYFDEMRNWIWSERLTALGTTGGALEDLVMLAAIFAASRFPG